MTARQKIYGEDVLRLTTSGIVRADRLVGLFSAKSLDALATLRRRRADDRVVARRWAVAAGRESRRHDSGAGAEECGDQEILEHNESSKYIGFLNKTPNSPE